MLDKAGEDLHPAPLEIALLLGHFGPRLHQFRPEA
jgi:hypothetical protein